MLSSLGAAPSTQNLSCSPVNRRRTTFYNCWFTSRRPSMGTSIKSTQSERTTFVPFKSTWYATDLFVQSGPVCDGGLIVMLKLIFGISRVISLKLISSWTEIRRYGKLTISARNSRIKSKFSLMWREHSSTSIMSGHMFLYVYLLPAPVTLSDLIYF